MLLDFNHSLEPGYGLNVLSGPEYNESTNGLSPGISISRFFVQ